MTRPLLVARISHRRRRGVFTRTTTSEKNTAAEAPAPAPIPPGPKLFVTNEPRLGDVTVIDVGTARAVATIPLGKRPRGVRVSPDGSTGVCRAERIADRRTRSRRKQAAAR
jgi:YVTN family beta-propeller protein